MASCYTHSREAIPLAGPCLNKPSAGDTPLSSTRCVYSVYYVAVQMYVPSKNQRTHSAEKGGISRHVLLVLKVPRGRASLRTLQLLLCAAGVLSWGWCCLQPHCVAASRQRLLARGPDIEPGVLSCRKSTTVTEEDAILSLCSRLWNTEADDSSTNRRRRISYSSVGSARYYTADASVE